MVETTNFPGASATVQPGTELNQTYRIDSLIGIGGMGEVFHGRNIQTGDSVAIKIVLPEYARDELILELFRKEARILNHLAHDAIVRYYVFSMDAAVGRPYLAMEFVDGQSLGERIKKRPLSIEECTILRRRVADGLHKAHEAGIIHRDISPDNVILPDGRVERAKIIDFGIAKSANVGGGTLLGGSFAGKYNFVSPEQLGLFGGEVTAKSDIYSLGLVLAAAVTGKPLDMSGSQVEVVEKRRVVPDLSAIPRTMQSLLRVMLAPDPAARFPSMAAVRDWNPTGYDARAESQATVVRVPESLKRQASRAIPPPAGQIEDEKSGWRGGLLIGLVALLAIAAGSLGGFYYVNSQKAGPGDLADDIPSLELAAPTVEPLLTNSLTPEIRGTWPEADGRTLTVTAGTRTYTLGEASELSSDAGSWRLVPATPLAEGATEVAASVSDAQGRAVKTPSPATIIVDASPPAPPSLTPIAGSSPPKALTGAWPESDAKTLSVELGGRRFVLGSDPALSSDGSGKWRLDLDAPLAPGTYEVTMEAADAAGNVARSKSERIVVNAPVSETGGIPTTRQEFIENYDGGDCFLALARDLPQAGPLILAYGNRKQNFEQFTASYRTALGEEADARFSQVTAAQCRVLDLLRNIERQSRGKPWLKLLRVNLADSKIANGSELAGTLEGLRHSNWYLLVVDDEGGIHNLTGKIRPAGTRLEFAEQFRVTEQSRGRSQLVLALSASLPLPVLAGPGAQLNQSDLAQLLAQLDVAELDAAADLKTFSVE